MMTTLFNLFCPIALSFSLQKSVLWMIFLTLVVSCIVASSIFFLNENSYIVTLVYSIFPNINTYKSMMISVFLLLSFLNLTSLMVYSFPVTTTLSFNFSMALCLWLTSVLILLTKVSPISALLPSNSPWYLMSFLAMVELISILVRPVTLCFRLLANMSAGHILLSLMCKMPFNLWLTGILFGLLEVMVSVVQAFVFLMLINVYLEEGMSH